MQYTCPVCGSSGGDNDDTYKNPGYFCHRCNDGTRMLPSNNGNIFVYGIQCHFTNMWSHSDWDENNEPITYATEEEAQKELDSTMPDLEDLGHVANDWRIFRYMQDFHTKRIIGIKYYDRTGE